MSLSLILYFMGIVPNIQGLFTFIAIFSGIVALVTFFIGCAIRDDVSNGLRNKEDKNIAQSIFKTSRKFVFTCITFAFLSVLIPPSHILYSIATVEVGQKILETEDGKEISTDLKDILVDSLAVVKKKLSESLDESTK